MMLIVKGGLALGRAKHKGGGSRQRKVPARTPTLNPQKIDLSESYPLVRFPPQECFFLK